MLDSPGPVFYYAERVGLGARPLGMLRFRKMRHDPAAGRLTVAGDSRLVELHPSAHAAILTGRPGITGLSQIAFAQENRILQADDPVSHSPGKAS